MKVMTYKLNFAIIFALTILSSALTQENAKDPDETRSFEEIVLARGYPLETHYCVTNDGYELKIYRIPGPKGAHSADKQDKPVVLFGHGLADSSDSQVINEDHLSVAQVLADSGKDVWLSNFRGNKHSRKNTSISPENKAFWNFSFHEMGTIDLVTIINMITDTTGVKDLTYIGHSQGGSSVFALCSINPDFCKKNLNGIIALAPGIYLTNNRSPFLSDLVNLNIDWLIKVLGYHKLFESRETMNKFTDITCRWFKKFCGGVTHFISEDDPTDNNSVKGAAFYAHYPSGASTRCLQHFAAIIRHDEFIRFDTKDRYPIENIKTKIALLGGDHDRLVVVKDLERLKGVLEKNNILADYKIYPHHGHSTFLQSKGLDNYIEDLIDLVNKFSQK